MITYRITSFQKTFFIFYVLFLWFFMRVHIESWGYNSNLGLRLFIQVVMITCVTNLLSLVTKNNDWSLRNSSINWKKKTKEFHLVDQEKLKNFISIFHVFKVIPLLLVDLFHLNRYNGRNLNQESSSRKQIHVYLTILSL